VIALNMKEIESQPEQELITVQDVKDCGAAIRENMKLTAGMLKDGTKYSRALINAIEKRDLICRRIAENYFIIIRGEKA